MYGPSEISIEQISSGGTVLYLHHDQQGSTRMLTGSTGKSEATMTYDAFGDTTGTTGTARTPLGYDGQYTSSDTGLVYLRARVYDPATAQFLTVDPIASITRAQYTYGVDDPLNYSDPTGLIFGIPGTPSASEVVKVVSHVAGAVATVTSVVAAGCAVAAAPTIVGEGVCGIVGGVALTAGAVSTAGNVYLAAVGAESPGPAIFDTLGLGAGLGGEAFEGLLGDEDLGAYAKTGSSLLSGAAFGEPFAEEAAEARGEGIGCGL
jgi:RHS repeat-associated protein